MNSQGMTLVEVLAALVLLGIVFVGFMTIFPQMTIFNNKTETKLKTMNEARILLDDFKQSSHTYSDFNNGSKYVEQEGTWTKVVPSGNGLSTTYRITKSRDVASDGLTGQVNLHQVYIAIQKDGKVKSETFGYIEIADE
ncbi:type II secretion system protein [Sporosarcina saromensis]|uniref:Type II secretion system protein n=1 Tax=Sporosarcina saromensis TaxID=359365 RepID=A0ABU4G5Z0_9BACL|nr:type II secretion system protein [Sporosarcina saromensis]MDW0112392.1 type II secretion system protein [Sporosarcina saromensis]